MKKCTGCDRLDNVPLGLNDKGDKYLACCPDNNYIEMTAVEWLYNKMYEHKGIITIEEFEQAKEMEKQQIIDAFDEGHVATWNEEAEQYYNEKYKLDTIDTVKLKK